VRKRLEITKREIVLGLDKSRCCQAFLKQSRVYPFRVYCPKCLYPIEFEHEVIWGRRGE